MDLIVHFDCLVAQAAGPAACGVVVIDHNAARPVHEAGYYLGDQPSVSAANLAALVKSLEVVCTMGPGRVDLRCPDELLIRQVTGASPVVDGDQAPVFNQIVRALLRLDNWQISFADRDEYRRPTELAERAMNEAGEVTDLHAEDARRLHHQSHTGIPQWTVTLLEAPGADCPARCQAGAKYPFGPDVPAGLCVHAALVALTDGPLVWDDSDQTRMTTVCPHCDVPIEINRVDQPDA
jgi:hypothetical protein